MSDERDLKSHQIMELSRAIERVEVLMSFLNSNDPTWRDTYERYFRRALDGPQ